MDKYGVSRDEVEGLIKSGEAKTEQEALEKVASGVSASKTKETKSGKGKGKSSTDGPEQAAGEDK